MLSIVIPVYNEATHVQELLFYLFKMIKYPNKVEIIVVDGGSTDGTVEKVKSVENVLLFSSPKGRGTQMNVGASKAKGNLLYFLHADSFPPLHFDHLIFEKIKLGNSAGCFYMRFDSNHFWLRLAGWFTKFNLKFFRGGDQSLFVEKKLFNEIGGFVEDYPIFEDYTFIRALYKRNMFCVIQNPITSSSRRYQENGVAKLQYHYWNMYLKKWFGASTKDLVAYYKKHII